MRGVKGTTTTKPAGWAEKEAARQREKRRKFRECGKQHADHLRRTFGLTVDQYDTMLITQNGACAICRGQNKDLRRLSVDHNHATGKIRGLLCYTCNAALGYFYDQPSRLRRGADYLEEHG
jgi:recombination endonuclease VII